MALQILEPQLLQLLKQGLRVSPSAFLGCLNTGIPECSLREGNQRSQKAEVPARVSPGEKQWGLGGMLCSQPHVHSNTAGDPKELRTEVCAEPRTGRIELGSE